MGMRAPAPAAPAPNTFDVARKRAGQAAVAAKQTQGDALKRRFAAMGALNSGSAIQAEQQSAQKVDEQLANQNEAIDAGQAQEEQRKAEVQQGRDFQAGEAEKQRTFQAGQAGIDRAFQDKVFSFDSASKLRALDQMDRQFGLQKDESEFNKRMAEEQAKKTGGLFGGGGFLGLGL